MLKSTPLQKHIIFGLNSNTPPLRPAEPVTNDRNGFEAHSRIGPYNAKKITRFFY